MFVMREANLRDVDLNLLVHLDALLEHRNITHAATAVYLSQPAMSRALKRLRHLFNAPLLVKGSQGYVLTPRAAELQPNLRAILADIRQSIDQRPFDPSQATGPVTIAATDHQTIVSLPKLMARLSKEAPNLQMTVIPLFKMTPERLESREVDLALGIYQKQLPDSLSQTVLECDRYITLLRQHHPAANITSAQAYAALDHIMVSAVGDGHSIIDDLLAAQSLSRRIVLQVPSFFAAMEIVAQSDLAVTLPEKIGTQYATLLGLTKLELPLDCPPIQRVMIWANTLTADGMHQWLRQQIIAL